MSDAMTPTPLQAKLLRAVGRGSTRDDILGKFIQGTESGLDVDLALDRLIEADLLVEALFGSKRGWLVDPTQSPKSAERIRAENDRGYDQLADKTSPDSDSGLGVLS